VDQVIGAIGGRDRASLQAGCSRLRQAYHELLTALGLDEDPMFQTVTRPPYQPPLPRQVPVRVRGRTVPRGR
jgi:hypothetical protein